MPLDELADAARRSRPPRSRGSSARGVAGRATATSACFRVGRVLEAGKHPNADRLQLCRVDVGEGEPRQIVCGAWNFGAGATVAVALPGAVLPGGLQLERRKLRGEISRRDDPRRGRGRARHRPHRDHGARRRPSRARRSRDVLPLGDDVLDGRDRPATGPTCCPSTASRARSRRSTTSSSRRRRASTRERGRRRAGRRRDRGLRGLPALHRPALPRRARSARRRSG